MVAGRGRPTTADQRSALQKSNRADFSALSHVRVQTDHRQGGGVSVVRVCRVEVRCRMRFRSITNEHMPRQLIVILALLLPTPLRAQFAVFTINGVSSTGSAFTGYVA